MLTMISATATIRMNWLCSGRLMNGLIEARLQHVTKRKQHRRDRHQHHQRIELEGGEQDNRDIHRNRHHLAVREVDDTHDPEDHRQPECHQAIDQAREHPADGDVEIDRERHARNQMRWLYGIIGSSGLPSAAALGAMVRTCRRGSEIAGT